MKIKKAYKIGSRKIFIRRPVDKFNFDGCECLGLCQPASNEILVSQRFEGKPIHESVETDVFMHESLHMLSHIYGIGLTEEQVSGLSGAIISYVRENKIDLLDVTKE